MLSTSRDDVVDVLAETLATRRLFCDLLSQVATSLEHNVSVPAARDFKREVLGIIGGIVSGGSLGVSGGRPGPGREGFGALAGMAVAGRMLRNPRRIA